MTEPDAGMICEAHPWLGWPHPLDGRDCPGPGMPAPRVASTVRYEHFTPPAGAGGDEVRE